MERKIFVVLVGLLFFYVASPLLFPMVMGGILAVLFFPWVRFLQGKKMSKPLSSGLLTSAITLVLIFPSSLLIFYAAKSGFQQIQVWKMDNNIAPSTWSDTFMNMPRVKGWIEWGSAHLPIDVTSFSDTFQDLTASLGGKVTDVLGGFLSHVPSMIISCVVIVLSVYFFLMDGETLIQFIEENSFFSKKQTKQIISRVGEMCRSVILAAIVSGGIQAFIEMAACIFTGTPHAAFIGFLIFIASFIPLIGSLPVALGIGVQQWLEGRQEVGMAFIIIGFIIFGLDGAVRPLFLKGRSNLHPLMGFVGAFGGLQTLGFLGVFLGPIIAALFVTTLQVLTQKDSV